MAAGRFHAGRNALYGGDRLLGRKHEFAVSGGDFCPTRDFRRVFCRRLGVLFRSRRTGDHARA